MSKNRIKMKVPEIRDRVEAEFTVGQLAMVTLNKIRATAAMDKKIAGIRVEYEKCLAIYDQAIQEHTEALEAWAAKNRDEFPKDRKSIEFVQGVIGFRTGTPKLALLNRKWNWEKVLDAVKSTLPAFIRNKPEVDRESIIGQREELAEFLPLVGVKVVQEESFFVEPKLTEVETRQVTKEAA